MLAGVSVGYYTRLERGNLAGASEPVFDALTRALQLEEGRRGRAQPRPGVRLRGTRFRRRRRAGQLATLGPRPALSQLDLDAFGRPTWPRTAPRVDAVEPQQALHAFGIVGANLDVVDNPAVRHARVLVARAVGVSGGASEAQGRAHPSRWQACPAVLPPRCLDGIAGRTSQ